MTRAARFRLSCQIFVQIVRIFFGGSHAPPRDYNTWGGEAGLVQWGSGNYGDQGWIRYNRHAGGANYIYADAHVEFLRWSKARLDEYSDHVVRTPLASPPE